MNRTTTTTHGSLDLIISATTCGNRELIFNSDIQYVHIIQSYRSISLAHSIFNGLVNSLNFSVLIFVYDMYWYSMFANATTCNFNVSGAICIQSSILTSY